MVTMACLKFVERARKSRRQKDIEPPGQFDGSMLYSHVVGGQWSAMSSCTSCVPQRLLVGSHSEYDTANGSWYHDVLNP